jgi:hypothetical protein
MTDDELLERVTVDPTILGGNFLPQSTHPLSVLARWNRPRAR